MSMRKRVLLLMLIVSSMIILSGCGEVTEESTPKTDNYNDNASLNGVINDSSKPSNDNENNELSNSNIDSDAYVDYMSRHKDMLAPSQYFSFIGKVSFKTPADEGAVYADETDLIVEYETVTDEGNLVASVINKSDKMAVVNSIIAQLNGNNILQSEEKYFCVKPSGKVFVHFLSRDDFKLTDYNDCHFEAITLSDESFLIVAGASKDLYDSVKVDLISADGKYAFKLTNNSQYIVNQVKVSMVYYKDSRINDVRYTTLFFNDLFPGETTYVDSNMSYNYVFDQENKAYDYYTCDILSIFLEESLDGYIFAYHDAIEVYKYDVMEQGDLLLYLKNNSNDQLIADEINAYVFDKDGNYICKYNSGADVELDPNGYGYSGLLHDTELDKLPSNIGEVHFEVIPKSMLQASMLRDSADEDILTEIVEKEDGLEITLKVGSNKKLLSDSHILIFYKEDKPVYFKELFKGLFDEETVKMISYPNRIDGTRIPYDRYEIFRMNAVIRDIEEES